MIRCLKSKDSRDFTLARKLAWVNNSLCLQRFCTSMKISPAVESRKGKSKVDDWRTGNSKFWEDERDGDSNGLGIDSGITGSYDWVANIGMPRSRLEFKV